MQRKKKRVTGSRKSLKLYHSIPSKLNLSTFCQLSHVSDCSIPLVCMALLLLVSMMLINPTLFDEEKSYAVEVGEDGDSDINIDNHDNSDDTSKKIEQNLLSDVATNELETPEVEPLDTFTTANDMSRAATTPSLSITISNSDQIIETTQGGDTVYGNYGVTLTGQGINSYTLSISGDANLTSPSGDKTTVQGVSGSVQGKAIPTNKWGYSWTDNSTTDTNRPNLTYKALSSTDTQLEKQTYSQNQDVSLTKKLVFAGKFGDVVPGNYKGAVKLSAVATAIVINAQWSNGVGSGITDMQQVNQTWASNYCSGTGANGTSPAGIKVGDTLDLKDTRDNNIYRIVKLEDGKCWMQQNLRLMGGRTLTPSDSDVTSNWPMPASLNGSGTNASGWTNDNNKPYSAYFNNPTNGVYYNWTAAIAMNDSSSISSSGTNASTSICPKGWKIPTATEYTSMLNAAEIGDNIAGGTKIQRLPYSFICAGLINRGSLQNVGSIGYYWSRTSGGSSDSARNLGFSSAGYANIGSGSNRYFGDSVRCLASN